MSVIIILLPPLQGLFHPSKGGKEMKKQHMDHSMRPIQNFVPTGNTQSMPFTALRTKLSFSAFSDI
jgi:hypothetical protein